jgi:hypothetical protein
MWFNSKQREEPYQELTSHECRGNTAGLRDVETGGAWLSSARVVRCWVKSRNERNPCSQLPARKGGHSGGTAGEKSEEGGDDVKSSCPLCSGLHTYYNGCNKGKRSREAERIPKSSLSSDCGLKPARMKSELLVMAGQHTAVNTFPGLVHTARHTMRVCNTRSQEHNRKGCAAEGGADDWGEVVTR